MRRARHRSEQAAIRYQHATDERDDRVLTESLAVGLKRAEILSIEAAADRSSDAPAKSIAKCGLNQQQLRAVPTELEPVSPP
jgi:hypothetical protein